MKKFFAFLVPALALCAAGSLSAQTGTVDQSELHDNVGWNMGFFTDMQQNIEVGLDGQLEGIKIRMASQNTAVGLPVAIFDGPGPHPAHATPAWSGMAYATQTFGWEWVWVDCSAANLGYHVWDVFTIRIGDGVNVAPGVSLTGNQGWPVYFYQPDFWEEQVLQSLTRLTFETYVLPFTLHLEATGSCGGVMTLDATHGSGNYWIVYGAAGISHPHGIDLQIANPQIATTMGNTFSAFVPAGACGFTLQLVDQLTHQASNPIVL
jgi:hypothetical protein